MVYPGAVHSRFEHSLGVYWLAGEAVHTIKAHQVGNYMFSMSDGSHSDSDSDPHYIENLSFYSYGILVGLRDQH